MADRENLERDEAKAEDTRSRSDRAVWKKAEFLEKRNRILRRRLIFFVILFLLLLALLCGAGFMGWRLWQDHAQLESTLDIVKEQAQTRENEFKTQAVEQTEQLADAQLELERLKTTNDEMKMQLEEMRSAQVQNDAYLLGLEAYAPGTVIESREIDFCNLDRYFTIETISDGDSVCMRISGQSYQRNEDITLSNLRYIRLLHFNYEHRIQVGELLVNESIAEEIREIFKELFLQQYEINSLRLVDDFWTGNATDSDTASVEANNSSAFNYRVVEGTKKLSNHALGMAVDINPEQNPYVKLDKSGNASCDHENARAYIDREGGGDHMISHDDLCYKLFAAHGFTWGGDYKNSKDYQHFEKEKQENKEP